MKNLILFFNQLEQGGDITIKTLGDINMGETDRCKMVLVNSAFTKIGDGYVGQ